MEFPTSEALNVSCDDNGHTSFPTSEAFNGSYDYNSTHCSLISSTNNRLTRLIALETVNYIAQMAQAPASNQHVAQTAPQNQVAALDGPQSMDVSSPPPPIPSYRQSTVSSTGGVKKDGYHGGGASVASSRVRRKLISGPAERQKRSSETTSSSSTQAPKIHPQPDSKKDPGSDKPSPLSGGPGSSATSSTSPSATSLPSGAQEGAGSGEGGSEATEGGKEGGTSSAKATSRQHSPILEGKPEVSSTPRSSRTSVPYPQPSNELSRKGRSNHARRSHHSRSGGRAQSPESSSATERPSADRCRSSPTSSRASSSARASSPAGSSASRSVSISDYYKRRARTSLAGHRESSKRSGGNSFHQGNSVGEADRLFRVSPGVGEDGGGQRLPGEVSPARTEGVSLLPHDSTGRPRRRDLPEKSRSLDEPGRQAAPLRSSMYGGDPRSPQRQDPDEQRPAIQPPSSKRSCLDSNNNDGFGQGHFGVYAPHGNTGYSDVSLAAKDSLYGGYHCSPDCSCRLELARHKVELQRHTAGLSAFQQSLMAIEEAAAEDRAQLVPMITDLSGEFNAFQVSIEARVASVQTSENDNANQVALLNDAVAALRKQISDLTPSKMRESQFTSTPEMTRPAAHYDQFERYPMSDTPAPGSGNGRKVQFAMNDVSQDQSRQYLSRTPASLKPIRSIYDATYDPAGDPFKTPTRSNLGPQVSHVPGIINIPGGYSGQPVAIETTTPTSKPDRKDFPTFGGRLAHKSETLTVVQSLEEFFLKLKLLKNGRGWNDKQIIEHFGTILTNDALQLFVQLLNSSIYNADQGHPSVWTVEQWHQRFLNHYADQAYYTMLDREHEKCRFTSSETDPYKWAMRFYELTSLRSPDLTAAEFLRQLKTKIPGGVAAALQERFNPAIHSTPLDLVSFFTVTWENIKEQQAILTHQSSPNRGRDRFYEKSSASSNRQSPDNSRYTTSKKPSDFRYSTPVQTLRGTTDFSKSNRDRDLEKRDQPQRSPENSGKSFKCYKCHQPGHMMNQCPELKAELEKKYGKRKAEAMFAACANTESDSDEETEGTRDSPEDRSSTPTPATCANATPLGRSGIEAGAIDTQDLFYGQDFDEADC
jgi:hypothetical protein